MKVPRLSEKEAIILGLLATKGSMYGLEMVKASRRLKRGTIYVTLGRMFDKGYVTSRLVDAQSGRPGPPRRKYRATTLGVRIFDAWELVRKRLSLFHI